MHVYLYLNIFTRLWYVMQKSDTVAEIRKYEVYKRPEVIRVEE